jgi:SAM-dependent methyltransferase
VCDADANRRFRAYARRHGWDPDEPFVGGYVDWEWRHARHAYNGLDTPMLGKKVLEFGCHFGGTSVVLASLGAHVEAVDVEKRYTELTRLNAERYGVKPRVRARLVPDTTRLPFADAEFDVISCNSVLEYVPPEALDGVLRELDRVLAPGGHVVVLGTSNRLWPYEPHTHRWLVNYLPPSLRRLLFAGSPRAGVSPWRLRGGLGGRYVDITCREGGRLFLELKAKMGTSPGRLKLLRAANRLLCPLGAHAGLVTPTITMVLQKQAVANEGQNAPAAQAA